MELGNQIQIWSQVKTDFDIALKSANKASEKKKKKNQQIYICLIEFRVEFQWLNHRWLIYGCFGLVLESLGKIPQLQIWDNLG